MAADGPRGRTSTTSLEVFGPERLLFGSDWPVCLLAAPYERVVAVAREALDGLGDADMAAVLGGTATEVYGLPPPRLIGAAASGSDSRRANRRRS